MLHCSRFSFKYLTLTSTLYDVHTQDDERKVAPRTQLTVPDRSGAPAAQAAAAGREGAGGRSGGGGNVDHEVIVVGHSMLPKGTATREVHETLSMVVLVDRRTHQILRASVTFTTLVNRDWSAAGAESDGGPAPLRVYRRIQLLGSGPAGNCAVLPGSGASLSRGAGGGDDCALGVSA